MFAPPGLCVCVPSWITDDKKPAGGQGSWQLTLANEARLPGGKESQTWDSVPVAVRLFPLVPWAPKMVLFAFSFLLLPREAKCLSSANEASRDKCVCVSRIVCGGGGGCSVVSPLPSAGCERVACHLYAAPEKIRRL